jgi:hypothetical protein
MQPNATVARQYVPMMTFSLRPTMCQIIFPVPLLRPNGVVSSRKSVKYTQHPTPNTPETFGAGLTQKTLHTSLNVLFQALLFKNVSVKMFSRKM